MVARLTEQRIALHCVVEHDDGTLIVAAVQIDVSQRQALLDSMRAEIDRLVQRVDGLLAIAGRIIEVSCEHQQTGLVRVEAVIQGIPLYLFRKCVEGFAKCVIARKIGKYVTAAIRHPTRMIGLRPMRSDRDPNTMKNGVASRSESATIVFAACASTLSVCVRQKSE